MRDTGGKPYLWHNGGIPGTAALLAMNWNGFTIAYTMNSTESPGSETFANNDMWDAVTKVIWQNRNTFNQMTTDLFPQYGY